MRYIFLNLNPNFIGLQLFYSQLTENGGNFKTIFRIHDQGLKLPLWTKLHANRRGIGTTFSDFVRVGEEILIYKIFIAVCSS